MDLTFIDRALGSGIPYITYAVPVFFLSIGVELVVTFWEHQPFYRLHDSINDLSCGTTEQVVGLRQGTFQGVFSWVFYLPLALAGYPPAWFAAMASFDTDLRIHTRAIGKLGPLEWVFNTPSHHRAHHALIPSTWIRTTWAR